MTAVNIIQIRRSLEESIATIIPTMLPDIKFIKASTDLALENQIFGDRLDGCRKFQIVIGPFAANRGLEIMRWNGSLLTFRDSLAIKVRYEFGNSDGGFQNLQDIIASDSLQIARQIHPQNTLDINDYLIDIAPNGSINIDTIDKQENSYTALIVTSHFDYISQLGD